ncbi:MAG: L-seryl-tRNA(Sec) selenium transferase [Desulfobacterales bacterium]|nr:L-seryl-tRNA(Sec) selenium transferase [Desulfobacterales bacterium]
MNPYNLPAMKGQMNPNENQHQLLRKIPGVDHLLELAGKDPYFENAPFSVQVQSIRHILENLRSAILGSARGATLEELSDQHILDRVKEHVMRVMAKNLVCLVNATGVVVHTNLGRSILSPHVMDSLLSIAGRYSNLEFDLSKGTRGSRYSCVEDVICEISGAPAAMVVNNNAGAVLLCLESIARSRRVIVSRGELVEIGGAFRIPDVMAKSGAILKEVGTTNRTHLADYENAIDNDTALLLKVHTSNYQIVGFSADVSLKALCLLGARYRLPVMEDLGSGTLVDFSKFGLIKEPTVQESVAAGADLITFSGDKLLGGPQAGIIIGRKELLDKIRQNPLTRALRIDKLTLAALESTLRLYRDPEKAMETIPTLRMLTTPLHRIEAKASLLARALEELGDERLTVRCVDRSSKAGGGALPLLDLPSKCVGITIRGMSANSIEKYLRENTPPVIGRIEEDIFLMDLRTVQDDESPIIVTAITKILKKA